MILANTAVMMFMCFKLVVDLQIRFESFDVVVDDLGGGGPGVGGQNLKLSES